MLNDRRPSRAAPINSRISYVHKRSHPQRDGNTIKKTTVLLRAPVRLNNMPVGRNDDLDLGCYSVDRMGTAGSMRQADGR